jgi:hypothetical protein
MRALLALVPLLASCTSINLRAGAVMFGDRPAFQATLEVGPAIGRKRPIHLTHEHGVAVAPGAQYVAAINLDTYQTVGEDDRPIARFGVRVRSSDRETAACGVRGGYFPIAFEHTRRETNLLGIELGGAFDPYASEAILEASIVLAMRVRM